MAVVSDAVQSMDRERMLGVRERIDRKIMEQIHPKDLFYQILDGLRSLTHYDHSSALLIRDDSDSTLRVDAEQIAWRNACSARRWSRGTVSSASSRSQHATAVV